MISIGVGEIVFLDDEEDTDHVMSNKNNKRSNGEDAEMTENEKKAGEVMDGRYLQREDATEMEEFKEEEMEKEVRRQGQRNLTN